MAAKPDKSLLSYAGINQITVYHCTNKTIYCIF